VVPKRVARTVIGGARWARWGLLGLLGVCRPIAAQWLPTSVAAPVTAQERRERPHPPTYWFEGAVIGGAAMGFTVVTIAAALCADADNSCEPGTVALGGLAGALLGGTIGALVGGASTAPHPRPLRGHPARAAAIGAAVGAVWSLGVLGRFCATGCTAPVLAFGVSTTAVSALAGLLVGL